MTLDEIKNFRQLGSRTPGHPENFITSGVETTTGPLGQGVASSVGMALAERLLAAEFGEDIVDHHTYVLCSDGDLMEGVSHEALALAGHYRLSKLIFLYDDNGNHHRRSDLATDSVDQVAASRPMAGIQCRSMATIRKRSPKRSGRRSYPTGLR